MNFELHSEFKPTGDQPTAIKQLVNGILSEEKHQTLLGVTGSGKTFSVANVVAEVNRPTLVLAHNKTLAAQLYSEFKQFFPNNAVEYFVSYYDYYQPEAYIPVTGTYIEKDLSINDEIERLRISTSSSLLSGRRDIIVVASVSCLYGIGNPNEFKKNVIPIEVDQQISRTKFLHQLVTSLYSRTEIEIKSGTFKVKGDVVTIYPSYGDSGYRVHFFGDEIEEIETFDIETNKVIDKLSELTIYPANLFVTSPDVLQNAIHLIQDDMVKQVDYFKEIGKHLEAKRLKERTEFDLEMIRELGYCSGIENYSRYLDGREQGTRPFCLLDYFPDDYLMVIDESHVTIPQTHAMYGGDRSRKENLVEYGFRLPAAMDNRPLKFEEFRALMPQTVFVSATPGDYEIEQNPDTIDQLVRPTGLIDPEIEVRPVATQVDDVLSEINKRVDKNERVLITTLTKRMSEDLTDYLRDAGVKIRYLHSDIDTVERVEIIRDLRAGEFDVLVGINLLREGLDMPEVSLVAILDADKEGFLRSKRSLIQTIGRAARNLNGKAILYGDKITKSMRFAIDETDRRRTKQIAHNKKHAITPKSISKPVRDIIDGATSEAAQVLAKIKPQGHSLPSITDPKQFAKKMKELEKEMYQFAENLEFEKAARTRDQIEEIRTEYLKS